MDLQPVIQQCANQLEPTAVIAIMRHESNAKPYQIGVNHPTFKLKKQPASLTEAVSLSKSLIEKGYNIDMGLMQINSANFKKMNLTYESVFDPCQNVKIGTQILIKNYQRASLKYGEGEKAFLSALSAYNTGHFEKGVKNGYVNRILAQMRKVGNVFATKKLEPKKEYVIQNSEKAHLPKRLAKAPEKKYAALNPYTASSRVEGFYEKTQMLIQQKPLTLVEAKVGGKDE